jgi:hypothetical protein
MVSLGDAGNTKQLHQLQKYTSFSIDYKCYGICAKMSAQILSNSRLQQRGLPWPNLTRGSYLVGRCQPPTHPRIFYLSILHVAPDLWVQVEQANVHNTGHRFIARESYTLYTAEALRCSLNTCFRILKVCSTQIAIQHAQLIVLFLAADRVCV